MVDRTGTAALFILLSLATLSYASSSFSGLLTGELPTQCDTAERYSAPGTYDESGMYCDRDYPFSGNQATNKRHCARINPGYVGQFIDNAAPAGSIRCRFFEKSMCPTGFVPHRHFCVKILEDKPRTYDEAVSACYSRGNLGKLIDEPFTNMRDLIRRVDGGRHPLLWWDGEATETLEERYGAHRMYTNGTNDRTAISVRAIESPRWDAPRVKKGSMISMDTSKKAYAVCTRRPKPSAAAMREMCKVMWPTMGVPTTFYSKSSTEQYCVWASHNPHAVNNARSHRHLHSACEVHSNMKGQAVVRGPQFDTNVIHMLYKGLYEMFTSQWQHYTKKTTNPPNTFALRLPAFYDYKNDVQTNTEFDGSINHDKDVTRRSNDPKTGLNVVVKMNGGSVGTFDSLPGEWLPVMCAANILQRDTSKVVYTECAQGFMEFYWNRERRCLRMYSATDRHLHSGVAIVNEQDVFDMNLALKFCEQIKDVRRSNQLVGGRLTRFGSKAEMDDARKLLQYVPPLSGGGNNIYKQFPALGAYLKHDVTNEQTRGKQPTDLRKSYVWRTESDWKKDKVMTEDVWNRGEPNMGTIFQVQRCTHWTLDYYGYSCAKMGNQCYMNDVPCNWIRRVLCEYTLAPAHIVN